MEITFLGTGAGLPSKQRNVSSLAISLLNEINQVWLVDCGEGTQQQILHTTIRPRKVTKIFISHMHGDHIFGLPGFLSSRSFQGGEDAVTLYGPKGLQEYVHTSLRLSRSRLPYRLHFVELDPQGGQLELTAGWKVTYLPLNHGILSFGFRFEEPSRKGELNVEKLRALNVPAGPLYGRLKAGEVITLEDGHVLDGKDFIGPDIAGKIITIIPDTRPCGNIAHLAEGADLLIHEATHSAEEETMAKQYYHSTTAQAAEYAKSGQVGCLLMNHISSRYMGGACRQLLEEARSIFPQTYLAEDLKTFTIK